MPRSSTILRPLLALAAALLLSMPAGAQEPAAGPVSLVVAVPPGGTGDIVARLVAPALARVLGQEVTVANRPGAGGGTGAQEVARSRPDGRTLLVGQPAEIVLNNLVTKYAGYDAERDLVPVTFPATFPLALVTAAAKPPADVAGLVAALRGRRPPGTFASAGVGTPSFLAGELFRVGARLRLTHRPLDGGAAAARAVADGEADLYFPALPTALAEAAAGRVTILAVTSAERMSAVGNVPTMGESGFADVHLGLWVGVFAPSGTSPETVARLNRAINEAIGRPEVADKVRDIGGTSLPMSPASARSFVHDQRDLFQHILSERFCATILFGGCAGYGVVD